MTDGRPTVCAYPFARAAPGWLRGRARSLEVCLASSKVCSEQRGYLTSRFIEACTAIAYSIVTDRGHRDRRDENLHRTVS